MGFQVLHSKRYTVHSVIDPADTIVVLNQLSNKRTIQVSIHKAASSNSEMGLLGGG